MRGYTLKNFGLIKFKMAAYRSSFTFTWPIFGKQGLLWPPKKSVPLGHTQSKCYVPIWKLMCPCSFLTWYRVGVFLNTNCFGLYHSGFVNVERGVGFAVLVHTVSYLTILFNNELQNQRLTMTH